MALCSAHICRADRAHTANQEAKFRFLISAELKENLFTIKKGDTITIKETQARILQIKV